MYTSKQINYQCNIYREGDQRRNNRKQIAKMAAACSQGKDSWPELVGEPGDVAEATIERENPTVDAIVYLKGTEPVTEEFRCRRVKVLVNQDGVVVDVPRIG